MGGPYGMEARNRVVLHCNLARPSGGTDDLVSSLTDHLIENDRTTRVKTYDARVVLDECEGDVDAAREVQYEARLSGECQLTLTVSSATQDVAGILELLHGIHATRDNLPGGRLFYFQQKLVAADGSTHRMAPDTPEARYARAPPRLSFHAREFHTNKTFATLHGEPVRKAESRVRLFAEGREWYDSRGVPYQLGMLLTGRPGCGKSSVIKAMAESMRRHIVSVDMGAILTTAQLHSLFYDDTLMDMSTGVARAVRVPQDRRLYVVEEADKAGGVLLKGTPRAKVHDSQVSLRDVLDVLDGGMETPGRVLVMTANDPARLAPVVCRAGRVNAVVEFGPVDARLSDDIYERLTGGRPRAELPGTGVLTPADVTEAVLATYGEGEDATRAALADMMEAAEMGVSGGHPPNGDAAIARADAFRVEKPIGLRHRHQATEVLPVFGRVAHAFSGDMGELVQRDEDAGVPRLQLASAGVAHAE